MEIGGIASQNICFHGLARKILICKEFHRCCSPFLRVAKLVGGQSQGREHGGGAAVIDCVGGQSGEQLREQILDDVYIIERRQGEADGGARRRARVPYRASRRW